MGFISHHEIEWGFFGDGVRAVVVGEFSMEDVVGPRSRVLSTEDLKVCFNFLVYPFGFSIQLGMIGCEEGKVVLQEFSKLSGEGGRELGTTVRYDFVVEAEVEVYFVEKEGSYPFSGDVFLCGTENHPLSKPMVDHNQKRVKARGRGKVGDKVTGDLLEGTGCKGANGGERGNGGMCVSLILLTGSTALNMRGQAGPPELNGDELVSFQVTRVASSFVIMATLEDGVVKGFIIGDIDASLVG